MRRVRGTWWQALGLWAALVALTGLLASPMYGQGERRPKTASSAVPTAERPSPDGYLGGFAAWLAYERDPKRPDPARVDAEVPRTYPRALPREAYPWDDVRLLGPAVALNDMALRVDAQRAGFNAFLFQYPGRMVIAFRGTEMPGSHAAGLPQDTSRVSKRWCRWIGLDDLCEDALQLLGVHAPQYELARVFVRRTLRSPVFLHSPDPLMVVGHSLGGGLAQVAVADVPAAGAVAWGYNPAQLNLTNRDTVSYALGADVLRRVRGFRVEGDNVSAVGPGFVGRLVVVPYVPAGGGPAVFSRIPGIGVLIGGFGPRHQMSTVMRGMVEGGHVEERAGACTLPRRLAQQLETLGVRTLALAGVLVLLLTALSQVKAPTGRRAWLVGGMTFLLFPVPFLIGLAAFCAIRWTSGAARGCLGVVAVGTVVLLLAAEWAADALSTFFCTLNNRFW